MANHIPSLVEASGFSPVANLRWKESVSDCEKKFIAPLLQQSGCLKETGVTTNIIVASWLKRRIQPLQSRGFEYHGARDPTRPSVAELSEDQILTRLIRILPDVVSMTLSFLEFSMTNPPPANPQVLDL